MLFSGGTINIGETGITQVYSGSTLIWQKNNEPDYLTLTIISGGTIDKTHHGDVAYYIEPEISKNGENWTRIFYGGLNVNAGDVVRVRNKATFLNGYSCYYGYTENARFWYNGLGGTALFDVSGNLLSMEYGSGFTGQTETEMPEAGFGYIFSGANINSAEKLVLPQGQTGSSRLILMGLFSGCSNLKISPNISNNAFNLGCESMFEDCTSLEYIKCLAESSLTIYCTFFTLHVRGQGTFVKARNAEWIRGYSGIPEGWTIIEE